MVEAMAAFLANPRSAANLLSGYKWQMGRQNAFKLAVSKGDVRYL